MSKRHKYTLTVTWTGNQGLGTSEYASYSRDHRIVASTTAPVIEASADPTFLGNPDRWNLEQLFVAAVSECHMLFYLALASRADVIVADYQDQAEGVMVQNASGGGAFESITLRPQVTIALGCDTQLAVQLHEQANQLCFIANSVNCPVDHQPKIVHAQHVL